MKYDFSTRAGWLRYRRSLPILFRLAQWSQGPGHDFDKPWAAWLLNHERAHVWWIRLVENPIVWLHCTLRGHYVVADWPGGPERRYCMACRNLTPYAELDKREQ